MRAASRSYTGIGQRFLDRFQSFLDTTAKLVKPLGAVAEGILKFITS